MIPDSQRALEEAAAVYQHVVHRDTVKGIIDTYLAALGGLGRERDGFTPEEARALFYMAFGGKNPGHDGEVVRSVSAKLLAIFAPGSGQAEEKTDG